MKTLNTRLNSLFNIEYPILLAPMAFASGGKLAAAVSKHGGLGIIGGGYGDLDWLNEQFELTNKAPVGVGFITWSLSKSPHLLTEALRHNPVAVMLSFGDPRPFVKEIRDAGAKLICQCQNMDHIKDAIEIGADVIVAQGQEAGGHGAGRGTMTFVPEAFDYIQSQQADSILVAAGGIADGRGLAASLMLGAEGALIGTRFWAANESLVHPNQKNALIQANGDKTIRTNVADIVRKIKWPSEFNARILKNSFTNRWHNNESELEKDVDRVSEIYKKAAADGNTEETAVFFGESAGIIDSIESVETIINNIINEAQNCLSS